MFLLIGSIEAMTDLRDRLSRTIEHYEPKKDVNKIDVFVPDGVHICHDFKTQVGLLEAKIEKREENKYNPMADSKLKIPCTVCDEEIEHKYLAFGTNLNGSKSVSQEIWQCTKCLNKFQHHMDFINAIKIKEVEGLIETK